MTAAQARPRVGRTGPRLWRPRATGSAPRRSPAPPSRRAARRCPARQPLKPARPWWDRGGRSPHPWRAPSRWPARPCAPCRARAAAGRSRRRVQLFPRRVRRERPRVSGAFGPASRTCRRLFLFLDGSPVRLPPAPARRASARKNNVKSPRREEPSEAVPGDAVCCRRPDGGKGGAINRAKYPPYPIPITLQHATRNKHS